MNLSVVIYSKQNCPNCEAAKRLLHEKGLGYVAYSLEQDEFEFKMLMDSYPEARQMPQIFINGQRVGGLAGLQAALKQVGL